MLSSVRRAGSQKQSCKILGSYKTRPAWRAAKGESIMTLERQDSVQNAATCLEQAFDRVFAHNLCGYHSVAALLSEQLVLVKGMCCVLKQLGLVIPDSASSLGFKATALLEDIVHKRGLRPLKKSKKATPSIQEEDALDLIFDAAVPFAKQHLVCSWAASLLQVLGLVVKCEDGESAATQELRELAAKQRINERNQQWIAACQAGQWPPTSPRASA
jgi:hypothetical protein